MSSLVVMHSTSIVTPIGQAFGLGINYLFLHFKLGFLHLVSVETGNFTTQRICDNMSAYITRHVKACKNDKTYLREEGVNER